MGPFTLRTDYPVFALGPALHVAGRAVCVSDALPFVARPLSRICLWLWLHGDRAFCHCRRLPDMALGTTAATASAQLPCRPACALRCCTAALPLSIRSMTG